MQTLVKPVEPRSDDYIRGKCRGRLINKILDAADRVSPACPLVAFHVGSHSSKAPDPIPACIGRLATVRLFGKPLTARAALSALVYPTVKKIYDEHDA